MNMVREKGNRKQQVKNRIKQLWGDLSDYEIALYDSERDTFFKAVQRRYGLVRAHAEGVLREIEEQFHEAA